MINNDIFHYIFYPSNEISYLIEQFVFIKTSRVSDNFIEKHIPDGSCSLIFNFNENIFFFSNNFEYHLPKVFLTIPRLKYVVTKTPPNSSVMILVCKASVFSKIFKINFSNYKDVSFIDLHQTIDLKLFEELKNTPTNEEKIKIFSHFLKNKTDNKIYKQDQIDFCCEKISEVHGDLEAQQLSDLLKMNGRSLRRNFRKRIGISIKTFCRIKRFNFLWHQIKDDQSIDFQELIYKGNFYDQSHFIHDFKEITGESPSFFFKRDLKNLKIFSGYEK